MTVNVTWVNDAPQGTSHTVTVLEDGSYTFTAGDFGFSDPGDVPANALLAVQITTLPSAGTRNAHPRTPVTPRVRFSASLFTAKKEFPPACHPSARGGSWLSDPRSDRPGEH